MIQYCSMKGLTILYENDRLLVFDKPSGLPVQGGKGICKSMDSLLAETYRERPLPVHRLDRDTSGVIVLAKTRESAALCSDFFSGRKSGLKKTYLACCAGIPEEKGIICEKLNIKGKELAAQTSYKRIASLSPLPDLYSLGQEISVSLAEIVPSTGRMHQIRRHLAQRGYPVLGDDKYGNFAINKILKKTLGVKRLLLHACSIYLPPSLVNGGLEVIAPLPDHFRQLMELQGWIFSPDCSGQKSILRIPQ